MFLHIGGDVMVAVKDVVAIVDVETMERGQTNQLFIKTALEEGFLDRVTEGTPNSWVVTTQKVYASPISSMTLRKRASFRGSLDDGMR